MRKILVGLVCLALSYGSATASNVYEKVGVPFSELFLGHKFNTGIEHILSRIGCDTIINGEAVYEGGDKGMSDFFIGRCYELNRRNYAAALEHYLKSSELGYALASLHLGYIYGYQTAQGKNYVDKAISQGSKVAAQLRAKNKLRPSLRVIQKSASTNIINPAETYALARDFFYGEGRPKKPYKAIELLEGLAQNDYAQAQARLARIYMGPDKAFRDPDRAMDYMMRAAKAGYHPAQYMAGQLFVAKQTPEDLEQAKYWLQKAAQQGNEEARKMLNTVFD